MRWKLSILVCLLFMFSFVSAAIPSGCHANIISYWKFDTDASDSIETNHGTLNGATIPGSQQKVGKSVSLAGGFDQNTNYLELPSLQDSKFSIELWFRFADFDVGWEILNKEGDYKIYIDRATDTDPLILKADIGKDTEQITLDSSVEINKLFPVISEGLDIFKKSRMVGATSASFPVSTN